MLAIGSRIAVPLALGLVLSASAAHADPTSGVDGALFRPSYDTNGVFALEGARLMAVRDLAFKILAGYAKSPLDIAVPGIGTGPNDTGKDPILDYVATLDMTFGMTVADRVAIGFDVASYRTTTGVGYGVRGRYVANGSAPMKSTGLISLRPLSNIDQSASPSDPQAYLGDGLSGPLDVRTGLKLALISDPQMALTAIASVFLPFGDDAMLLGDHNIVYEPKLAFEWRPDRIHQTRVVANAAVRIRNRSVLEAYDTQDMTATDANAKVFLDVGSEAVAGLGATLELAPRLVLGAEAQAFIPLPDLIDYGACRLYSGAKCSTLTDADYWPGAKHGDFTVLGTAGLLVRASADLTVELMGGTGQLGARADEFRVVGRHRVVAAARGSRRPRPQRQGRRWHSGLARRVPRRARGQGWLPGRRRLPRSRQRRRRHPRRGRPVPERARGQGRVPGHRRLPASATTTTTGSPMPSTSARTSPRTRTASRTTTAAPIRTTTATASRTRMTSARTSPRPSTASRTTTAAPTSAPRPGRKSAPTGSISRVSRSCSSATDKLTTAAKNLLVQVAAIIKQRKLTIRIEVHVPLGTRSANGERDRGAEAA